MNSLLNRLRQSPTLVRVAPFVIFLILTTCQGLFGGTAQYWFYLAKTVVGAAMVWAIWPVVEEMRLRTSLSALVVGVGVFAMWIGLVPLLSALGLDPSFAVVKFGGSAQWNPLQEPGWGAATAWFFIAVRITGMTLVVPPLEEVFFRSFLYRYIANPRFETVPLGRFLPLPFLVSSLLFALEHREWLAGLLCGFAYQGLVCWKKRLGDAIVAHAITNLLLGLWVVWKGAWHFW